MPRKILRSRPLPPSFYRVGRSFAGLGLFAAKPIPKGQYIIRYRGRRISNERADTLDNRYMFEIGRRGTIDGSGRHNIARYANHSCRPNADSDVVKGEIKIRAIKNIKPGDEITYDYGEEYIDGWFGPNGCKCPKCRAKRAKKRREQRLRRERRRKREARLRAKAREAGAKRRSTARTAARSKTRAKSRPRRS